MTTGTLRVLVQAHMTSSDQIPKQVQVLRPDMSVKTSSWITSNSVEHVLDTGVYLVRLNLSSGKQLEQVSDVADGETTTVEFNIGQFSPRETQEWMYFTHPNAGQNPNSTAYKSRSILKKRSFVDQVSTRRWEFLYGTWTCFADTGFENQFIDEIGESLQLPVAQSLQFLEIIIPDQPSVFVGLPSGHQVRIIIRIAEGPTDVVPELDIAVSVDNDTSQALLSLITSGDITNAKTLVTADDAEQLLYSKMADPTSAAIGGYYLLKSGELHRMHNWADNLANFFRWMPDGAIIHAWQLIQQATKENNPVTEIRTRLLDATHRGIPIYTEGLRLLYEGLTMLSFELNKNDASVEAALKMVSQYMEAADMSQQTTTFTGIYPDLPGFEKKSSTHTDTSRIASLYF